MNIPKQFRCEQGNLLLLAVVMLAILAMMAGEVLRSVVPRFHLTYQVAGWQESRHAAEAGVDVAMGILQSNLTAPLANETWTGWTPIEGKTVVDCLGIDSDFCTQSLPGSPNSVLTSGTIHLDNLEVTPPGGSRAFVDVQVSALYPDVSDPARVWFRIRSLGISGLPGPARAPTEKFDTTLRRFSLDPRLRANLNARDLGVKIDEIIPAPRAARAVEVLAKPIYSYEMAILTEDSMTLGLSNRWKVDSYNSSDPNKSNNGLYDPTKTSDNGHIASNKERPLDSPYGPLIDANGARVNGTVSTNGGDDPSTATPENVADAQRIDPERIYSDYYVDLEPLTTPDLGNPTEFRTGETIYPSTTLDPSTGRKGTAYIARQPTLGSFTVSNKDADGREFTKDYRGKVTIIVKGDIDLGSGTDSYIVVPPYVDVTIFAEGNIDFGNGKVNVGASSSNIPAQLSIYGMASDGAARAIGSAGNPEVAAVFYGPDYTATFKGTAEWYGSVVCNTYLINGGGNGGVHYDEANNQAGEIIGYRVGRYFEDSRQ